MTTKALKHILLILIIGILILSLSACTPSSHPYISVEKIGIIDKAIYISASQHCVFCRETEIKTGLVYYASEDDGQTWEEITLPGEEIMQILGHDQNKQSAGCLSTNSHICYQITGKEQVEISNDGGATWKIDWQFPIGRKLYMERRTLGLSPDTIPFDIQTLESNNRYFVIVALGNQGVLVKLPDGNWNRYAVGTAVPIPYQAANFREAGDVLYSESFSMILIAIGSLLSLSLCVWIIVYVNSDKLLRKKILTSCLVFLFSIVILPSYYIFLSSSPNIGWLESLHFRYIIAGVRIITNILPFISFWVTWLMVIRISLNKDLGLLTLLLSVVFSVILYFCILLPFQLWALGTISVYETALVISWLVGIIVVLIALISEFRIAVLAIKPISKQEGN